MLAIDKSDWFENIWLLWPTPRIAMDNLVLRRESAEGAYEGPFQDLLVFANAGTDGFLFTHPVEDGVVAPNALGWYQVEVELMPLAPNLRDFVNGWLTEKILL